MSKYDIVITFITIIYGLMLTDLFLSFHKLIRVKKRVKWHWLPILAAWYLFIIILKNWWDLAFFQGSTDWMNIIFFIAYGHLFLLLFLLVSTALPDFVEEGEIDLKNYYFTNHRYFWGLMTGVVILSTTITFFKKIDEVGEMSIAIPVTIVISILLFLSLAISKNIRLHSVLLIVFVLEAILEIFNRL